MPRPGTRRIPFEPQVTLHGCGVACLLMVCGHHLRHVPDALRTRELATRRWTARQLLDQARELGLDARGVRIPLDGQRPPRLPRATILHLEVGHYVVLDSVSARRGDAVVLDPSVGRRRMPWPQLAAQLSGVALVFQPLPGKTAPEARARRTRSLRAPGGPRPLAPLTADTLAVLAPGLLVLAGATRLSRHPSARAVAQAGAAALLAAAWDGPHGPGTRAAHAAGTYRAADDFRHTLAAADTDYFVHRGDSDLLARWRTAGEDRTLRRLALPWALGAAGYTAAALTSALRHRPRTGAATALVWALHTALVATAEHRAGTARRERLLAQEQSRSLTADLLAALEQAQAQGPQRFRATQQDLVARWRGRVAPLLHSAREHTAAEQSATALSRRATRAAPLAVVALDLAAARSRRDAPTPHEVLALALLAVPLCAQSARAVRALVRLRVDAVRHARLMDVSRPPPT
ncbi:MULTISPECIES: cysteine peptidase family C39 domain-containing protein [unclassified Streptomyces]|uniref:cysteine peptidase family C39 domain-containing protein n=1 Tax=unclassified Streptomyces TaxID=2593676 RepID=UPI003823DE89